MSIPFSRSTRSITNDSFRPSLIALAIGMIFLAAWGAWFVFARVSLYDTSTDVQIGRDGSIVAKFSADQLGQIRPGQEATVTGTAPNETYRAQVLEVANRSSNRMEPNTVRLHVYSPQPLKQAPSEVKVQVEEISPLQLLARTSEKMTGATVKQ